WSGKVPRPWSLRLGSRPCWLAAVRGDLDDQLLEDGVGERFVIPRGDHEGAGAADYAVIILPIEIGLERENRPAVDANAGWRRFVAGERQRAAPIVGAVAGDVDDAPVGAK